MIQAKSIVNCDEKRDAKDATVHHDIKHESNEIA
jgi:hypothetical protein